MDQYLIGHRGAAGLAPENTLKAFRIGCENGADFVECDIHLSKDKELIVFHDNTLERTTNGKGWVRDFTLQELQAFDAGQGEKIPTLGEVFDLVHSYKKKLVIEIKGESWEIAQETTTELVEFIKSKDILNHIRVVSFWHNAIKNIKAIFPSLKTEVIMMVGLSAEELVGLILKAKADGGAIRYDYISPQLMSLAQDKNLFIAAWVMNDEASFTYMKNLGVNGLTTDYPGRFKL